MKHRNSALKYGSAAVTLFATGVANAAIDPAITGAVSTAQTDGVTLAGLITTAILMMFAAKFLRRAA